MREFVFYSGLLLIHLSTARLCRCETTSLYRQHAIQNSKHYRTLCNGETQRLPVGGAGSPPAGSGAEPMENHVIQL